MSKDTHYTVRISKSGVACAISVLLVAIFLASAAVWIWTGEPVEWSPITQMAGMLLLVFYSLNDWVREAEKPKAKKEKQ